MQTQHPTPGGRASSEMTESLKEGLQSSEYCVQTQHPTPGGGGGGGGGGG